MAVRSRRILGPTVLTTSVALLYTVPAGRTLIIRHLRVANVSAATRNAFFWVNGSGDGSRVVSMPANSIPATGQYVDDSWWALDPGDELYGQASANSALTVSAYGALLLGEPE